VAYVGEFLSEIDDLLEIKLEDFLLFPESMLEKLLKSSLSLFTKNSLERERKRDFS
jgi:hypothetical protein